MTPTTPRDQRPDGGGRQRAGDDAPREDEAPRDPMEGTASIVRGAAEDAARLATAPARAAARAAGASLDIARDAAGAGIGLAGRVVGEVAERVRGGDDGEEWAEPDEERPDPRGEVAAPEIADEDEALDEARRRGAEAAAAEPARGVAPAGAVAEPDAAAPAHVSEEPVLAAEFAERGAEDGAGAEVRVDPPWEGYDDQSANDVVRRLGGASPELIAAVQLYEGFGRRRKTILQAAERALARAGS